MPFAPSDVSGLYVWLKADAISGLNDGDKVATWADMSGGGRNFAQGTDANRPVYKTNVVYRNPVVRFTAANATTLTSSATLANATAFTILVVHTRTASTPDYGALLSSSGGTYGVMLTYGTTSNFNRLAVTDNVVRAFSDASTGVRIQSWRYKGSVPSAEAWRDGVAQTLASNGYAIPSAIGAAAGTLWLGGTSSGYYWDGDVAEVLIYTEAVSDADLLALHTYAIARWETAPTAPSVPDCTTELAERIDGTIYNGTSLPTRMRDYLAALYATTATDATTLLRRYVNDIYKGDQ